MLRSSTLVLVLAVLLSACILTGATPSVATEYQITAHSYNDDALSDFQIIYSNNDFDYPTARLSDPGDPDTIIQFSKVRSGTDWFDVILKTPGYGETDPPTSGTGGYDWWFGHSNPELTDYIEINSKYWTYSQIARAPIVPLPPTLLLFGSGLLGLGALGWRRKRG
jgi:hypothetical protein